MAKYNTYTLENGLRIIHLPLLQAHAMSCLVRKEWPISAST